mmetsp:Transcript_10793/g.18037  ORF Transcript_10793/g.18037 Transcript_10793/m.18037 type:complete len:274 (-) Transcript_10793:56-877(-)
MDLVLEIADELFLDSVYEKTYPLARDNIWRQANSTYWIAWTMATVLYFTFSSIDFYFFFDKRLMRHKQFLPNQVRKEIASATWALFVMALMATPVWLLEVRGYSQLYTNIEDYGWGYFLFSIPAFLMFTDMCIYWIHRWFHHPLLYPIIHKEHHKWKVPTPYASIAFHPLDGFSQGFPYHLFAFLFPLQRHLYLILFFGVQLWTISIHDQVYVTYGTMWESIINGADHHTEHHLKFNVNYGQFTCLWDRMMGTHMLATKDAINPPESKLRKAA